MRSTHTLAIMAVCQSTWDEIAGLLKKAGYDHAFLEDSMLDMTGIALQPIEEHYGTRKETNGS